MQAETEVHSAGVFPLVAKIVAAYVSNNSLPVAELPNLIRDVYQAVGGLTVAGGPVIPAKPEFDRPSAVRIRASVRPDGIMSLIDGKSYKTLKRHLTSHGLDPKHYRERFGLPADYPMVAPSYVERRSAQAKAVGSGQAGVLA